MEYEPQIQLDMALLPPATTNKNPVDATLSLPSTAANAEVAAPLSHLWEEFQAEHIAYLDDSFKEMQRRTESGESLFSVVLPPSEDELGIENVKGLPIDIKPILQTMALILIVCDQSIFTKFLLNGMQLLLAGCPIIPHHITLS